jgi:multicomponent Na+:H+ antiporter subunit E
VIRYGVAVAWLTVVWVAFWRDLSVANVSSGVLLSAIVLWLFPYAPAQPGLKIRLVPALRFAVVFAWSVVKANAIVAWEVVTPQNRINEGVVAVPLASSHPVVITLVSHAIILAPGTMVVDIDREPSTVLFVHALHLRSVEAVRQEVLRLEQLAIEAFGGVESVIGGEVAS